MPMDRELKYVSYDDILDEDERPTFPGKSSDIMYEGLLDIIQVGEMEGMSDESIDRVLNRVMDYLAECRRKQFKLHLPKKD